MSFYDNIQIAPTQLPLSEVDIQQLIADKANFQTKSLEGMYGAYEITAEGHLEKTAASGAIGPDGKTRQHTVRMVDAHGIIEFYTCVGDEWFYFKVRFREGRITHLFRLRELTQTYSRTCTWELELSVDELNPDYDTEVIRHELSLLDANERQHLEDEFSDFDQQSPKK